MLDPSWYAFLDSTHVSDWRVFRSMGFMFSGNVQDFNKYLHSALLSYVSLITVFLPMQHLYVYGVLIFEAMATFVGQVSVLSLIAIFGAATTTMVCTI